MATVPAGGSGKKIRQVTNADVEPSAHQTAGLDDTAVPDELETGTK